MLKKDGLCYIKIVIKSQDTGAEKFGFSHIQAKKKEKRTFKEKTNF